MKNLAREEIEVNPKLQLLRRLIRQCYRQNITHSWIKEDGTAEEKTDGALVCPRTFDGFLCWDETPAGATAFQSCPGFVIGFDPKRYAYKKCMENGVWFLHPEGNRPWTNYTTCVDIDDLNVFVKEKVAMRCFLAIGWGLSLVIIIIYAVVRYHIPGATERCWMEQSEAFWIITVPVIPLFGLHFVLIPFRPSPEMPGEKLYQVVSALLTSLQGVCVAVLFCFTNHDVVTAAKTYISRYVQHNDVIPMTGLAPRDGTAQV
ncbi:unnamed protein product [Danaus chrysippus]|uniref:(African queen) hypothetical protein n=1 Tax=Danaus chrysippus TaxID=151541 RepID=A0A8J2MHV4_9NEOP|nr:unnamed protein product [Danaus chrysippus]